MSKVFFVCGNHAKSTFSYYLAKELSLIGKTVVISTDSTQPVTRTMFMNENSNSKSLGKLLSYPILTQRRIFDNMIVLDDNLAYLSYAPQEDKNSYPDISTVAVKNLMTELSFADYIVIDSSREHNELDKRLYAYANQGYILISADCKGMCYYDCFGGFTIFPAIAVQTSKYNPIADMPCKYFVSYAKALEAVGNIADLRSVPMPKSYNKVFNKLQKDGFLNV